MEIERVYTAIDQLTTLACKDLKNSDEAPCIHNKAEVSYLRNIIDDLEDAEAYLKEGNNLAANNLIRACSAQLNLMWDARKIKVARSIKMVEEAIGDLNEKN
jgi:hypothetical protein